MGTAKIAESAIELAKPAIVGFAKLTDSALHAAEEFRADSIWRDADTVKRVAALRDEQSLLRSGQIYDLDALQDTIHIKGESRDWSNVQKGVLSPDVGRDLTVVVRHPRPWAPMLRPWQNDLPVQEISPALFGSVLGGVERRVPNKLGRLDPAYVQRFVGENLYDTAERLTGEPRGDLKALTERFRKPIEEALVETKILGRMDDFELNFRAIATQKTLRSLKVIDNETALSNDIGEPRFLSDVGEWYHHWAGKPLLPSTSARVADFVNALNKPNAMNELKESLGVYPHFLDAMKFRAKTLDSTGKFPQIKVNRRPQDW